MSRPLRIEFPGAMYHVMARGNERRAIFRDRTDRLEYLDRLGRCASRFEFSVYAYCLMTNHVHMAIETGPTPLSRIMLALQGAYTQAFNRRHRRVGHLFQGRYKALLVHRERHLLTLVRYIHLNPVEAHVEARAQDFEWSSDRAYRGSKAPAWLKTDVVLASLAPTRRAAIHAYETLMGDERRPRYEDLGTHGQLVKGDEEFVVQIAVARGPELFRRTLTPARVADVVARECGYGQKDLRHAGSRIRGLAGYLGREMGRIPLVRMAELFGKHDGTIVRDVRRVELELRADEQLREQIRRSQDALSSAEMQR